MTRQTIAELEALGYRVTFPDPAPLDCPMVDRCGCGWTRPEPIQYHQRGGPDCRAAEAWAEFKHERAGLKRTITAGPSRIVHVDPVDHPRTVMQMHVTHPYAGNNKARQEVGDPGHCERCTEVGHIDAHPNLGCGDVGCTSDHGARVLEVTNPHDPTRAAARRIDEAAEVARINDLEQNLARIHNDTKVAAEPDPAVMAAERRRLERIANDTPRTNQ